MDSLGTQFGKIIQKRFDKIIPDALYPTLKDIFEQMKINSSAGRGFQGQQYNPTYQGYGGGRGENAHSGYARKRELAGLDTSPVVLRFKTKTIEQSSQPATVVRANKKAADIGFASSKAGVIFKYHHDGTANGGKTRKIFPEQWQQIPPVIYQKMRERIRRVFGGR